MDRGVESDGLTGNGAMFIEGGRVYISQYAS